MQKGFTLILALIGILAIGGLMGGSYYFGKMSNASVLLYEPQQIRTLTPSPSISKEPEVLKCKFNSKWFGFSFNYSKEKIYPGDVCYAAGYDYGLTSYTWPNGVFGLTFYPRNGLDGKKWWRENITDEAGYLKENKYLFVFTKTPLGVKKMIVGIDDNKVIPADHVEAGPFRGSNYYFGEKWVIRDKSITTGGPCSACEEFEKSLQLIPITEK